MDVAWLANLISLHEKTGIFRKGRKILQWLRFDYSLVCWACFASFLSYFLYRYQNGRKNCFGLIAQHTGNYFPPKKGIHGSRVSISVGALDTRKMIFS
ncbi:hypothetical protein EYC84_010459 [Monilinia fructicola]|uniref:Uncharacterized protein n=1 Tax=Monilinia fructicola TaxID=38448 RepID=A0A5M9JI86_MONFR|nr:hypothetical protein EYC84_010459 [Monilinia fructicola]